MDKQIALSIKNVSKTFRIPHEKVSSLRGAFTQAFRGKTTYEEFKALDDVSFEVKKGEFFGIIGRNGSGKSTLLKVLAGIYQPDKGKVHVNGLISPFLELGIGFNPELSGRDNVYLNATVLGLTKKQIDQKFDDIVRFSELERFIDQKLKNYSSGMQVRLAFSVSIHANRDILLMDEVLAVGDSNFQSKCLSEFVKYKEMGKTVILVTHDIATVQKYCDRTLLLRNGKVIVIGKSDDVGNEYIYQNMSDEERRILGERQEIDGREGKKSVVQTKKKGMQKTVEIVRIEFLDGNGRHKNVFTTGDDMSVRVYFKRKDDVSTLNFGVAIFNQENHYAFGVDTFMDKIDTEKYLKKNYYQINYKNIPLKTGSYYVNSAIYGDGVHVAYDFVPKSSLFKVFSVDKYHGMINIDHTWS